MAQGNGRRKEHLEARVAQFKGFPDFADQMGVRGFSLTDVRVAGTPDSPVVHMFFRLESFSEVVFAYRSLPAGVDPHELLWLAEELATGALHRIMRSEPTLADPDGVIWLQLRGQLLVAGPSAQRPAES